LRPVRKVERVGEHSAVVCHCEYIKPLSASFCSVGMLIFPPNGDHDASPVPGPAKSRDLRPGPTAPRWRSSQQFHPTLDRTSVGTYHAVVKTLLVDLARHQSWADAEHWHALEACRPAIEDPGVRARLHHLHQVQRAFLWLAAGNEVSSFKPTTVDDFPSTARLREYAEASSRPFAEFVAAVTEDRLQAHIELPFFAKVPTFSVTVAEALLQAMTHSQWHRGQNATRLRELGGEPPTVDLIIWYLKERPPAVW